MGWTGLAHGALVGAPETQVHVRSRARVITGFAIYNIGNIGQAINMILSNVT